MRNGTLVGRSRWGLLVAACGLAACTDVDGSRSQIAAAVSGGAITASTVTYSTRPIDPSVIADLRAAGSFTKVGDYRSYIEPLLADGPPGFCTGTQVTIWNSVSNHATCVRPGGNFASRTHVEFTTTGDPNEIWQIQIGPDYGLGGEVFLDDQSIGFTRDDIWQGRGETFLKSVPIGPGHHVLDAYGMENCCDGDTFGQYATPGAGFQSFATVQPPSVCARIEQALGPAWKIAGTTWKFSSEGAPGLGCRARDGNTYFDGGQPSAAQDDLLRSVMLVPSDAGEETSAACAVLEQSLELCRSGTYTSPAIPNNPFPAQVTFPRSASCHPGAEVNCTQRHQPVFADIFRTGGLEPFDGDVEPVPDTYCSGQVSGTAGYATSRPVQQHEWVCEDSDLPRLNNARLPIPPLGYPAWPGLGTRVAALTVPIQNECRVLKAVTDCVLPNLGPSTVCNFAQSNVAHGQQFSGRSGYFNNYCFRIEVLQNSATPCSATQHGSAHYWGRAMDLNVTIIKRHMANSANDDEVYDNAGNVAGCVDKHNFRTDCTNTARTADIDLPAEFVSVMEGCGFTWLGRYGNGRPGSFEAEGGHLGCDPMHFELPERKTPREACN